MLRRSRSRSRALRIASSSVFAPSRLVLVEIGQTQDARIQIEPLALDLIGATATEPISDRLTIRNIGAGATLQVNLYLSPEAAAINFSE